MPDKVIIPWKKVRELFREGHTAREVAELCNVNYNTLKSRIRREGIRNPNPVGRPRKDKHRP